MKKLLSLLLVPAVAGCLTSKAPEMSEWVVASKVPSAVADSQVMREGAQADYGIARLSQLVIRAPYDSRSIQVLRADGTLVADPYNHFAAIPSQLLKGPIQDALGDSKRFTMVVGSSSSASVSHIVEVTVTRLCLDCATEEKRMAEVECTVLVLNRDRQIVWTGAGVGREDAVDGDFGRAFSKALKSSLEVALGGK